MTFKKSAIAAAVALTAMTLASCGSSSSSSSTPSDGKKTFAAAETVNNLGNNIILKGYKDLDAAGTDLKAKLDALEDGGATAAEMTAAQESWKAARVVWESGEGHIFGPIDSLNTDPNLDSWPLNTATLQGFLNDITNITADKIRNFNTDVQGFHTIEYLLFGDGVADNEKTAAELTNAELTYLKGLGEVFKERTEELVNAWTTQYDPEDDNSGPYINELTSPGSASVYKSYAAVMEELINGMIGIADEVGNAKVADPLGASLATADTTLVESQYSWNSLTDFHNNIQSIRKLYTGVETSDGSSGGANGVYDFVKVHDAAVADRILAEINDAMNKIALIDGDGDTNTTNISSAGQMPFRNAIKDADGRTRIDAAVKALNKLQKSFEEDVLTLIAKTNFSS